MLMINGIAISAAPATVTATALPRGLNQTQTPSPAVSSPTANSDQGTDVAGTDVVGIASAASKYGRCSSSVVTSEEKLGVICGTAASPAVTAGYCAAIIEENCAGVTPSCCARAGSILVWISVFAAASAAMSCRSVC